MKELRERGGEAPADQGEVQPPKGGKGGDSDGEGPPVSATAPVIVHTAVKKTVGKSLGAVHKQMNQALE